MSDLISREAAIEALKRAEALTRAFGYHNVIETIRELPAIDPVKHGRWIYKKVGGWKCSECGVQAPSWCFATTQNLSNYCPNCGAKMGEGDDDT